MASPSTIIRRSPGPSIWHPRPALEEHEPPCRRARWNAASWWFCPPIRYGRSCVLPGTQAAGGRHQNVLESIEQAIAVEVLLSKACGGGSCCSHAGRVAEEIGGEHGTTMRV